MAVKNWLTPLSVITVYTDGACTNDGYGGWACVVMHGTTVSELKGQQPNTTSNRMEMTAALKALEALPIGSHVYIHTDSQYLKNGINWVSGWKSRNWKTLANKDVKNRDLWEALDAENARHVVSWFWVKGHDGHTHNERCDLLATTESKLCNQLHGKKHKNN